MSRRHGESPRKPSATRPERPIRRKPCPNTRFSVVTDALRVLEAIADQPGARLPEVARASGITKTKVFRILKTLETSGYVIQEASQTFFLHQKAYLLGQQAKRQWDLARVARAELDALAEATKENVHLVVRDGLSSVVVDLRQSPHPIRMYAEIGRRGPLHAGGTPKVLLAFAPPDVLASVLKEGLQPFTGETTTSSEALLESLERIRLEGYHVAVSDLDEGAFSIAAPIRNLKGEVIAAVSVAGPEMRLNEAIQARYIALVTQTAERISIGLGGHPSAR